MNNIQLTILGTAFWALLIVYFLRKRFLDQTKNEKSSEVKNVQPNIKFHYRHKDFLMTLSENKFFDIINLAIENNFYVFPQIHLSAITHAVDSDYGRRYANRLSVDYLICDRQYRRPILVIELDDKTHNKDKVKQRDANVEHMLEEAKIPLLRFRDINKTPEMEIIQTIRAKLKIPTHIYSDSQ